MKFKTINSFSAWTVDRLTSARRATLTTLATFLIAMTAQTAWADGVEYINASGTVANTGNETVTAITSSNAAVELVGGWYVVNGNVTINGELTFKNDVDLILADGATLSVKGLYCMDNDNINQNLTIYGQSLGTGKVSSDANHTDNTNYGDFRAATITINGGIVVAESEGARDNDMPGIRASVDLIINGGQVSCANAKVKVGGTITLGWQKATDYIWINTIKKDHYSQDYTQDITLSKSFVKFKSLGYDIYSGTATASDIAFENDPLRRKLYANKWEISDDVDGRSEEKAFGISSVEELKLLSMITNDGYSSGRYFKLKKNITFTYTDAWNAASSTENNFTPIGLTAGSTTDGCFKGHFDGQGYYISGIRINNDEKDNGLFRYLMEASVKNLTLKDSRITGSAYAGGIAGQSSSGTIACTISGCVVENNVYIYAKKVTDPSYAGGIVGDNGSTIIGCSSAASVKADYAGGIAGSNNGTIEYCFANNPTVSAGDISDNYGAIVGRKEGSLSNNYYYTTNTNLKGVGYYQTDNTTKIDMDGARKAYTVTLGTYVSMDGTATAHGTVTNDGDISITSYANNSGIMYTTKSGGTTTSTIYAGATETINLTYSGTVAEGYIVGYKVNDGEATAGNTITMPAENATITATTVDVWGVAGGKDGSTADKAYTITSTAGLDLLAQKVNAGTGYSGKFFKLGDNITYGGSANNFTPIGNNNNYFYGTFDGQRHTISGIKINNSDATYQGVFGLLYGTVENLVVSSCSIVARQNVGAIAGKLGIATIENCSASDDVILSGNSYVGGIVGASSKGTIKGCVSAAAITGKNIPGINTFCLGGIAGATLSDSKVIDNLFTGAITGDLGQYIGAIVGEKDSGTLTNNVHTSTVLGGIGAEQSTTGADEDGARKAYTVTLSDGVAPSGTATEYNVSGITVYADNNIILYNNSTYYAAADQSVKLSYSGVVAEGCGVGYKVNDGEATAGNTITMPAENATITKVDMALWGNGDGSETNPYVITTTAGLDLLAQKVNAGTSYEGKYFKLGDNIAYDKNTENNFTPIGYTIIDDNNQPIERPFRGHFDGNGKTISGINLNNSDVDNHGIFGYLYGTVKNLVVNNCSIVADHNIGAIVGVLYGTIENCHVGSDVTLSGHSHVGGIAGWCADATIKGCTSAATIKGITNSGSNANNLGGIVGATNGPSSSLTDNLFTGAITGDLGQYIGAIFGYGNEYATLTNNVYTSTGFGGIGAKGSTTGADGAGARKAVEIGAAEGVTITPTGEATTYNVSGITTYKENTVLGYDSKLYAGATDAVKLSIANTGTPETGYEFSGFTAGEGVTIISSENVYTLTVPASDVTVDVVYQAIIYNITYKGVEDDEDNPEAYTVANESFTLSNPSREGYVFAGWTYEGQTEPTKTVTIAKGSTGDKTFTANWEKLLTNTDITVSTIADQTYTGSEIKPAITVKDGTTDITDQCDFTYNSNKVVGTAEVVISAKESSATYAGEKTVTFKIAPKTVSTPTITLSGTSFEYSGEAIKPTVTVKDGETTIPAEEYTVGYSNNIEAGTATVTITDNEGGNYTVSGTATFTITPKPNTAVVNVEETPVAIGGEVYYKSTEDIYEKMMYKAKGISIGLSAKASNRIEVTAEGVKFSKGTSTTMAMLNLKFGDIIKLFFRGIIRFNDDGSIFIVKSLTRGDGDTSSDGMIDLVSGAEYKVLKDGALVLTIVLENEEAVIEGISVTRAGTSTDEPTSIVVTAKNKYWTFSCDQDVKVPEGVKVYTCQLNSKGTKAIITELSATELGGVIKANNGVLLSSDPGDYTFVFSPETTSTAKTYENNALVAVVKPTHLSPNDYYVLKDNEFHVILDDETEVPANKAVLKKPTGASGSRAIGIDEGDDATRIWGVSVADEDAVWYTVSGQRIDKPTKKGLYIKNGVKVVVK